jgi:LDH2 family malate/lactate/ureidoglycolate dehydrogenase
VLGKLFKLFIFLFKMKIKIEVLRKKVLQILNKSFNKNDSKIIVDYLLWAEMSGNKTQGILKLTGSEPLQEIKPLSKIKIERETKLSQLINAEGHPAPLVARVATEAVISKAKKYGFGIVGVHNTFSSNGAQAFYVEQIAKKNLIGIMCSRSPAAVTGFGSIDPLFGTNPIGFAFPTKDEPLVFDMATSAITWYGLILAKVRGENLPRDIAIDSNGELTINPQKAMDGALLPFDRGYKGAGLSLMIELLAGPLTSSSWIDNKTFKEEWGSLFIAINPNLLVDIEEFKSNCSDLIKKIKNSRKQKGTMEIRLPGEHSMLNYQQALKSGFVDIDEAILRELKFI